MESLADQENHLSQLEKWLVAIVFALSLSILWRAFSAGLSIGHDLEAHYFRIAQIVLNIREGEPFSMWARYGMRGYGYPILMFYAPLSYWLVVVVNLLGFSLSVALRLVVLAELFLAGWGLYLLTRRYFRPFGAFIAGIAYMFSPYMLYNSLDRGAFPELLGLALIPFVLLAFEYLIDQPIRTNYIRAFLLLVLILLSHNVVPFIIFPLLAVFVPLKLFRTWGFSWDAFKLIGPMGLIVILGLGVTAAYWLPALTELQFTHSRLEESTLMDWPSFSVNFLDLGDIVTWPVEPIDSALSNRPWVRSIGLGQVALSLIAIAALLLRPHPRRWTLLLWGAFGILSLYLLNNNSFEIWLASPLPSYIQLPTRFLGTASLVLAILSGFTADLIFNLKLPFLDRSESTRLNSITRMATLFLLAATVSFSGWQWLYPIYSDVPAEPTATDVVNAMSWTAEGEVWDWGAAASGETLPMWVSELPPADGLMGEDGQAEEIQRLQTNPNIVIGHWSSKPSSDGYTLVAAAPTNVVYQVHYFPGWQAELNGQTQPVRVTSPYGFMELDLPAGEHELLFRFGLTPIRRSARVVSLVTAGLFLLSLALPMFAPVPVGDKIFSTLDSLKIGPSFLLVTLALFGLRVAVDRINNPLHANRLQQDGSLLYLDVNTNINFSQQFIHLGYSGPERVSSDETFEVVQYWRAFDRIGVPYGFGLRVADDTGIGWNTAEVIRPMTYTEYPGHLGWRPDAYVRDPFLLQLQPGTPPGEYWLESEAFQRHVAFTLRPDRQAGADPTQARIGKITVTGRGTADVEDLHVQTEKTVSVTSELDLIGWSLRPGEWRPGEQGAIDLLWMAKQMPAANVSAEVVLLTKNGEAVSAHPFEIGSVYPMTNWIEGEVVRDKLKWVLPASLPSGELTVAVRIGGDVTQLGPIKAEAPERIFERPVVAFTANETLEFAHLTGYDLAQEDRMLRLVMVWEAVGETDTSYRVFVHVRNAEQEVKTQSDSIPAEWTRPTSGWLQNEYISDRHNINLHQGFEPGDYQIFVGMYDEKSGERIGEFLLSDITIQ